MMSNVYLLIFALAFMGCVLATPLVTRVAAWAGAIDRPDQFRRIHKGAVPRMGGLGLAFGLTLGILPVILGGYLKEWELFGEWWGRQWAVMGAAAIILAVGVIDDARGMRPRLKLLGQAAGVLVLYIGGIRIEGISLLSIPIPLSYPQTMALAGYSFTLDIPSLLVTMLWFLGCMNIWNLIDGMDGLASGVGLLVSGTLMIVALIQGNYGSAALAAALAGSLAGFLLYNWHPACIFLGDSGSLLIGLLIGVIGVQDSLKGASAVAVLTPLLAMGLPISDTMMAIFRRWVRNLPLSSADRRHVHHLLIGLGLNPRQAAFFLYTLTAFLCTMALLGVAYNNEFLALLMGLSGCTAFLLILTSRRDELATLMGDLRARGLRKKQEKFAAKETWEAIQRIELCESPERIWESLLEASRRLGSDTLRLTCYRDGEIVLRYSSEMDGASFDSAPEVSGSTATFRLPCGQGLQLIVSLHQASDTPLSADIAFRSLQRLALATSQRLDRLFDNEPTPPDSDERNGNVLIEPRANNTLTPGSVLSMARGPVSWGSMQWFRGALGWGTASGRHRWSGGSD
ncbi:MAG: UDP-N-acetylmuramyl pentapeptide phosphotransferase/UDP-N-acetylglucosamine-phosphate transferase [Planctomycetota bacterium]|nr:UDP-N-acetylmuramyl pentapeptide phosphotransferase/UDP-N-acetylglucosamine-phosphate transferase [Planctomycetota bacterium]